MREIYKTGIAAGLIGLTFGCSSVPQTKTVENLPAEETKRESLPVSESQQAIYRVLFNQQQSDLRGLEVFSYCKGFLYCEGLMNKKTELFNQDDEVLVRFALTGEEINGENLVYELLRNSDLIDSVDFNADISKPINLTLRYDGLQRGNYTAAISRKANGNVLDEEEFTVFDLDDFR